MTARGLTRRSCPRLTRTALVCLACVALPGCSKIRSILIINRFHEDVQVKIYRTKTFVPADGHAFVDDRQHIPYNDSDIYVYSDKGVLLRQTTFFLDPAFFPDSEVVYQDDLVVVDVGPK